MKLTILPLCIALLLMLAGTTAYAEGAGQIVIVNNAALKTAQGVTIQVYKMNGKDQHVVKTRMVIASEDCTNGCGNPSTAIDAAPGTYKIQIFGGVVLDTAEVTFPLHTNDEFVWMISNRANATRIRAHAPGVTVTSDKGPFRLDLVTYTKGADIPAAPAAPSAKKEKRSLWPFKPNTSDKSFVTN